MKFATTFCFWCIVSFVATYAILSLLWGCSSVPQVVKPYQPGATCTQACGVLAALQCPEAKPIEGITCVEYCETTLASGGRIDLQIECVAGAGSQEQVRLCNVECR